MAKRRIIIGQFGPSARQILDAAIAVNTSPNCEVVVDNSPKEGGMVFGGVPFSGRRAKDYDRGLAYLHDQTRDMDIKNQVFLGGACDPTTWRQDEAIPMLEEAGCAFWNPQVEDWSAEHARLHAEGVAGGMMEKEDAEKSSSYVVLFVFDPQTRAIASLNEAIEYICAGRRRVVLVAAYVAPGQEVGGQQLSVEEAMDINIARAELFGYASAHGVPVFPFVQQAVAECIDLMQEAAQDHNVVEVG